MPSSHCWTIFWMMTWYIPIRLLLYHTIEESNIGSRSFNKRKSFILSGKSTLWVIPVFAAASFTHLRISFDLKQSKPVRCCFQCFKFIFSKCISMSVLFPFLFVNMTHNLKSYPENGFIIKINRFIIYFFEIRCYKTECRCELIKVIFICYVDKVAF